MDERFTIRLECFEDMKDRKVKAVFKGKHPRFSDNRFLRIEFFGGTFIDIEGGYDGRDGEAEDEYPLCVFTGSRENIEYEELT
jgi:hypothetical protein